MPYTNIAANTLIKKIVKLGQNSQYREEEGLAVIYGTHLVTEALSYGILHTLVVEINSVLHHQALISRLNANNVYVVTKDLMRKINLLATPTTIVGLVQIVPARLKSTLYTEDCLVLENIQDPGNLGTILRTALAAGVKNILLSPDSVDVYNVKVLRASQGIQFGLNILPKVDILDFINKYQGRIIATTLNTEKNIYGLDLTQPIAWIFGNEGHGLSRLLLNKVKTRVKIPLVGEVESLNLAMAATVCLFEMVRQRLCR